MIRETIVVEGKNDAAAVRRAVDADIIITSGFGITRETLERIRTAQERCGVIVLTDPDFMGDKIRSIISSKVKGIKHAYIPREEALLEDDVGIENASPENIIKALSRARYENEEKVNTFSNKDMTSYGLSGGSNSSKLRAFVGSFLGIGYGNAKQFLKRLNKYSITREELENALKNSQRTKEDDSYEK